MRRFSLALGALAILSVSEAHAQEIRQTTWTGGPTATTSTNLTGETAFRDATGHALWETIPGQLRWAQFVYTQQTGRFEVLPVREAGDPVAYYDYQGSGGTPVYPAPVCLESRFWLQRNGLDGSLAWMFHVNVNGQSSDPCGGEIDATYTILPNGVATLLFSDESGESQLDGFDHFWINQWADGHVIGMGAPEWSIEGTIDRVIAVQQHEMILVPSNDTRAGFPTSDNMNPEPWSIVADLDGRMESAVFDVGQPRDWGSIELVDNLNVVPGAVLEVYVRTGASEADTLAQPWEGPYGNGDDVSSPANSDQQFIQYAIQVTLPDISQQNPVPAEPRVRVELFTLAFDTDGDGLEDNDEILIGTDPNDWDSDDDGLSDGDEPLPDVDSDGDGLINALDPDSDDDGLFDGTESGLDCSHPDTNVSAGNCKADADPSTTTDPLNPDTDGGGVSDGSEDFNLDGAVDPGETDPTAGNGADDSGVVDTDGDGLSDGMEDHIGTDPNDADTDDDGLLDGDEHNPSSDTDGDGLINPLDVDSDNDALFDGTEDAQDCSHPDTDTSQGTCTADADPSTTTFGLVRDSDGGGASDGSEDCNLDGAVDNNETDPNAAGDDSAVVDSDGDGLSDCVENTIGSDPNDGDSDDDGIIDGQEPNPTEDTDGDGVINILDEDSDGDGLFDGTEVGNDCSHPDTDVSVGNCIEDADPSTTTSPLDPDTDDGGVSDGDEDTNKNGAVDPGEGDPNDPSDDNPNPTGGGGNGGAGGAGGSGGATSAAGGNGGASSSSGQGGAGANAADGRILAQGGCGCGVASPDERTAMWALVLGLALLGARRRSRRD